MSFTQEEISDFLSHYVTIGDTIKVDSHRLEEHSYIGYGELFLPYGTLEFSVHLVNDPQLTTSICMTQPDDFGCFEILLHQHFINPMPNAETYRNCLRVACIRQLVKIAIDEMPAQFKDFSHSTLGLGQVYKKFPAALDHKPELQAFFQNQFLETNNLSSKDAYFRLINNAILNGAVNIQQYEIDLEALRFVNPGDLALTHWSTMKTTVNRAIRTEINNRVQRLFHTEYNGNVLHPEFELFIEIH